jgi:hypothetical protein
MITVLAWVVAAYRWNIIFSVESFEIVGDAVALSVGLSDGKLVEIESENNGDIYYLITFNCFNLFNRIWQMGSCSTLSLSLEFNRRVNTQMSGIDSELNKLDDSHVAF